MKLDRRNVLHLSVIAAAIPTASRTLSAQAPQAGPRLTQILRTDLVDQGQAVQETVVGVVDFGPGSAAPWHMHPGAQEKLMEFLFEQMKSKKHQIVMATHSPAMIRNLPPQAIKIMSPNLLTGQIELPHQSASPAEAFYHIGEPLAGKKTLGATRYVSIF